MNDFGQFAITDQLKDLHEMCEVYIISGRKDRRGQIIRKGSKDHHITFRDRLRIKIKEN